MKRKNSVILSILFCISGIFSCPGNKINIPDHQLWPRPVIIPLPDYTSGVNDPVISLNGRWSVSTSPQEKCWMNINIPADWTEIEIPSSAEKQNIHIYSDQEYAFKKWIAIPSDYFGKRIIIRFEGVTGTASAWINGHFLREHFGGFTIWNCDITEYVTPGEGALLTVGIIEESQRSSSGFNTGGIIRNVTLMALPQDFINRFNVETDLDENYKNGVMKVWLGAGFNMEEEMTVKLTLKDPAGNQIKIYPHQNKLTKQEHEIIVPVSVPDPLKWDAEHPHLYQLEALVIKKGKIQQRLLKNVGFRKVEIKGVKMLINGKEVKLRGVGRFDSDPIYGKYLSEKESYREVKMLKEANLNFVRPSCYPASEDYLNACDELGLYVQAENAVTFARGSQDNPEHTGIYMSQMAEMIEAQRSHPSIIIWELANETWYGINIGKTYEYAKAEDPARPVIYSWSHSVPEGIAWPYEIYSYHYPDWDQDLGMPGVAIFNGKSVRSLPEGMPVLHDEFAHGSSYYPVSLDRDPGMHNFWGESIKRFWERMFTTEGCLGGAIWAGVDENAGGSWVYEWGMIDLWRRARPEYWLMKKAFSPIRIEEKPLPYPLPGESLVVPVKNWYDHTNFKEVTIHWSVHDLKGTLKGPDIPPHGEGEILLPVKQFKKGDRINLKFFDAYNRLVDEFILQVSPEVLVTERVSGPAPEIREDTDHFVVSGGDFEFIFSKTSGLMIDGIYKGYEVVKSGPHINLIGGAPLNDWMLRTISANVEQDEAVIRISGSYNLADVSYQIRMDGSGLVVTRYAFDRLEVVPPEPTKIPWNNQDAGGFEEVGIYYVLSPEIDRLSWNRKGLWSVYPEDHIGRNQGTTPRHIEGNETEFGKRPTRPWSHEESDFSLYGKYDTGGRGTHDFRSMKEYIYTARVFNANLNRGVCAESNGTDAVRLEVIPDRSDWIDNDHPEIVYAGNWKPAAEDDDYHRTKEYRSSEEGDYAEFSFYGTGISWIGTMGSLSARADVYIDNNPAATGLTFNTRGKRGPRSVLFSKTTLSEANHTIRIVAKAGRSMSSQVNLRDSGKSAEIPLDAFAVHFGKFTPGEVKLIINNLWNHTKMGLGNYMKDPVLIHAGYQNEVRFRLTGAE